MQKRIWSFWQQGKAKAPDSVRFCWDRWAQLNPDHDVVVLDGQDAARLLADFPRRPGELSVQALSDVLRLRLLRDHAGIWTDATVLPVRPLKAWADLDDPDVPLSVFEKPGADRLLSSWFLAVRPDCPLIAEWDAQVRRYWQHPRELVQGQDGKIAIPADPIAEVSEQGPRESYPYFWLHYLFAHMLHRDDGLARLWARARKLPASEAHRLQARCRPGSTPSGEEIRTALAASPVQKLDWRVAYPLQTFRFLLDG